MQCCQGQNQRRQELIFQNAQEQNAQELSKEFGSQYLSYNSFVQQDQIQNNASGDENNNNYNQQKLEQFILEEEAAQTVQQKFVPQIRNQSTVKMTENFQQGICMMNPSIQRKIITYLQQLFKRNISHKLQPILTLQILESKEIDKLKQYQIFPTGYKDSRRKRQNLDGVCIVGTQNIQNIDSGIFDINQCDIIIEDESQGFMPQQFMIFYEDCKLIQYTEDEKFYIVDLYSNCGTFLLVTQTTLIQDHLVAYFGQTFVKFNITKNSTILITILTGSKKEQKQQGIYQSASLRKMQVKQKQVEISRVLQESKIVDQVEFNALYFTMKEDGFQQMVKAVKQLQMVPGNISFRLYLGFVFPLFNQAIFKCSKTIFKAIIST